MHLQMLEELCNQLYPTLLKYFLSQVANYHIAEELTQETLFRACSSYTSFKGHSSLKTWIFGIAHHTLHTYYRKSKNKELSLYFSSHTSSVEEQVLLKDDYIHLTRAIHDLEETERQVVLLRSYVELDFISIGEILSLTPNNCRVIYCRSRQKLKKLLEKDDLK